MMTYERSSFFCPTLPSLFLFLHIPSSSVSPLLPSPFHVTLALCFLSSHPSPRLPFQLFLPIVSFFPLSLSRVEFARGPLRPTGTLYNVLGAAPQRRIAPLGVPAPLCRFKNFKGPNGAHPEIRSILCGFAFPGSKGTPGGHPEPTQKHPEGTRKAPGSHAKTNT